MKELGQNSLFFEDFIAVKLLLKLNLNPSFALGCSQSDGFL